jgi:IclR family transcriptional regulator, KDG regulon repressor
MNKLDDKKEYFKINSVIKVFKVIELLTSQKEFDLADLSKQLCYPKPTVQRILLTLQSIGYVRQNPESGRYLADVRFFELGTRVIQNMNLREIARSTMIELSKDTGETANLGILDGTDVVCIDKVETNHFLRSDQPIGSRLKSYQTGFGKAILAFLKKDQNIEYERSIRAIENEIKSKNAFDGLIKDLDETLVRGFSIDNQEALEGVTCIGAPILDHRNRTIAGLSIAGPSLRMKKRRIPEISNRVMAAAEKVSIQMGAKL